MGEIGRGGMGIVYEAEQISLERRVALKVLPFATVLDKKHLQRFKTEAQAAARLHHTNIVPVYSVGCERGVHYYAMQFIDGDALSTIIDELRRTQDRGSAPAEVEEGRTESELVRCMSSDRTTRNRAFFRAVAELGAQAAEALQHAHEQGVVHRDVKPANLLVDGSGKLWITDFGLARFEDGRDLTVTGELVGTIRYMSPEQAQGRAPVDHRTDVYSLGITLYELLTLRPAFVGDNPQELLRRIATEEPPPPRRLRPPIPLELETVLLKAIAKSAAERYPTAQELADDLHRFLAERPIHARRPTLAMRARKWAMRHRGLVAAAALFLLLAVIGLALSTALVWREKERTKQALAHSQANYRKAREAVDRMLLRVGDRALEGIPQMTDVRRELLEEALQFYEGFLGEQPSDPALRGEVAYCWIIWRRRDSGRIRL